MTKVQRRRQRNLKRKMFKSLFFNFIIWVVIITINCISFAKDMQIEENKVDEVQMHNVERLSVPVAANEESKSVHNEVKDDLSEEHNPKYVFNDLGWEENDDYLLAKIAMAEAEGCSLETKMNVIATVLNRTRDKAFPNSIKEVIYEKRGNTYQFSPIGDGRWDKIEPNEECWLALEKVKAAQYDFSLGALYFESCQDDNNWHSRNLNFLFKSDTMRFYK